MPFLPPSGLRTPGLNSFPSQLTVPSLWMHNELSYSTVTPTHVFFCSIKPAEELGYTPIADFREVLPRINPVFLEMLKKRQVVYRRTYIHEKNATKYRQKGCWIVKSWQDAFFTQDPKVAEDRAKVVGFSVSWDTDEGLQCQTVAFPPTRYHPKTGEEVWFNQIIGWDPRMGVHVYFSNKDFPENIKNIPDVLGEKDYQELYDIYPQGCFYADDLTPVDLELLKHVHSVTWETRIEFPWLRGDILVADNYYTAHGRTKYSGERLLLAILAKANHEEDEK
eukprot:TRINITY_DN3248_c0_g1_i11.p1 TRINITY_DN3248_c0_g1~~TRINITY_DN3248_c0_g1_i11.p1  ORF type:complete len:279 (+),score=45.10 TRINITY_DN3248_c0_g1_i11:1072-1908(+)